MALQCGIIGITNVGKTTLYICMSNTKVETTSYAYSTNKSNMGFIKVPDKGLTEELRKEMVAYADAIALKG